MSVSQLAVCFLCIVFPGVHAARKLGTTSTLPDYPTFVDSFRRPYKVGSAEFEERRALYEFRVAQAAKHNANTERRWNAGVNLLSDWTETELAGLRGWNGGKRTSADMSHRERMSLSHAQGKPLLSQASKGATLPRQVSWLHLNMSNRVPNQGGCGSCWAVATANVLKAHAEIYGRPRTFSAQELVSCVPNPKHCGGTGGCEGATVELALKYVMANGLAEESDTPYHGVDEKCGAKKTGSLIGISGGSQKAVGGTSFGMEGWERLPENAYEPLMRALYEKGPVGVSVAASSWFSYQAGIFDDCHKDAIIDHAVTLMAYGEDLREKGGHADKYWAILNSWGPSWGENGYIRLIRRDDDASEQCGTDNQPQEGTACEGGPKKSNSLWYVWYLV